MGKREAESLSRDGTVRKAQLIIAGFEDRGPGEGDPRKAGSL